MDYLILTSSADEATTSAWNECLNESEFAAHYTAPEFFHELYFRGRGPFAVLAMEGSRVYGVVTGVVDDRDLLCGATGSPHICLRRDADPEVVGRTLAAGLVAHARGGIEYINAYSWAHISGFRAAGFRARSFKAPLGTILLDLAKGSPLLFRECSETRRNKIRRAMRAGVEISEMNVAADFDDYYAIYKDWCTFKRTPCQPHDLQRAVFESRGNRLILVARHDGRIVGVSTFRYRKPGIVEYAANVSRREETKARQNDLLLWRAIEWSVEQRDLRYFSMAGAHFFLQKFGGRFHSTYGYSHDRSFLRRRSVVEGTRTTVYRAYQALPGGARKMARKLLNRESESG